MLPALRHSIIYLALSACCTFPALAIKTLPTDVAEQQTHHVTRGFPGWMIGHPAGILTANYLRQPVKNQDNQNWHNVSVGNVVAAHAGKKKQQIIIMTHLDTWTPVNDKDMENPGGPGLQGVNDNASALGIMLELAEQLRDVPTRYGIRFIATSEGTGANILRHMSHEEQRNTLLVINLHNLIVGDKLYFNSGQSTPQAVRKLTRDRAIFLAHKMGIKATTSQRVDAKHVKITDCCSGAEVFDKAGIPVLMVETTNWSPGRQDDYQQHDKNQTFPDVISRYNTTIANRQYLDEWLPGKVENRSNDVMQVMLPLVKELAKAEG